MKVAPALAVTPPAVDTSEPEPQHPQMMVIPRLKSTSEIAQEVFGATKGKDLRAKIQMIYRLVKRNGIPVFRRGKRYFFDPRDFMPTMVRTPRKTKIGMKLKG